LKYADGSVACNDNDDESIADKKPSMCESVRLAGMKKRRQEEEKEEASKQAGFRKKTTR